MRTSSRESFGIDLEVPPSGTGCAECDAHQPPGWWVHLRRCAQCGHVGCCDSSPSQHATAHARQTGHRYVQSFEPGEDWFYDYQAEDLLSGPSSRRRPRTPTTSPPPAPPAGSRTTGGRGSTDATRPERNRLPPQPSSERRVSGGCRLSSVPAVNSSAGRPRPTECRRPVGSTKPSVRVTLRWKLPASSGWPQTTS